MAPLKPMTPAARNVLRARFAAMFQPPATAVPRRPLVPAADESFTLADVAAADAARPKPPPDESFTLADVAAGEIARELPAAQVFRPNRSPASLAGLAAPAPVERNAAGEELARAAPAARVSLPETAPAPPALPRPDSRPELVGGGGKDTLTNVGKQTSYQSGLKVAPDVLTAPARAREAEIAAAADAAEAELERARQRQAAEQQADAAFAPQMQALQDQAATLADQVRAARERQQQLDADAARLREVDPNRWWSTRTTGQRIMLAAANIFSGALAGLTGGPSRAGEWIEAQIDRDTASQIRDYENARTAAAAQATTVGQLVGLYGDIAQARGALNKAKAGELAASFKRIAETTNSPEIRGRMMAGQAAAEKAYAKSAVGIAEATQPKVTSTRTEDKRETFTPGSGGEPTRLSAQQQSTLETFDARIANAEVQLPQIFAGLKDSNMETFGQYLGSMVPGLKGTADKRQRQQLIDRWVLQIVMGEGGEQGSGANFKPSELAAARATIPQDGDTMAVGARKTATMLGILAKRVADKALDAVSLGQENAANVYARRVERLGALWDNIDRDYLKGAYGKDVKATGLKTGPFAWETFRDQLRSARAKRGTLAGE